MSELDDYDKRCGREPLTTDQVCEHTNAARRYLERADKTTACETQRVIVWLDDLLGWALDKLERVPTEHRCGWCWKARGATSDTWQDLPKMSLDDIQAHTLVCEHNPLVKGAQPCLPT